MLLNQINKLLNDDKKKNRNKNKDEQIPLKIRQKMKIKDDPSHFLRKIYV